VPLHTCSQQDARIHYATLNTQPHTPAPRPPPHPPSPTTSEGNIDALDGPPERRPEKPPNPTGKPARGACPLRTQQRAKPTTTPKFRHVPPSHTPPTPTTTGAGAFNGAVIVKGEPPTHPQPTGATRAAQPHHSVRLLRKEVIQPHLPVRLPCYDFVPIASPTFDNSLPQGVRPSASGVTNFRDVTGGVYKARERIHRSVADLRLLATPTSRGRVADPDPN
jgi:hypothetical protein